MEEEQLLPYRRCFRPMMVDGKLDWNAGAAYIQKPEYAKDGAMFVRSFYHIQEELQYLFKYIEPASGNLNVHFIYLSFISFRVTSEGCDLYRGLFCKIYATLRIVKAIFAQDNLYFIIGIIIWLSVCVTEFLNIHIESYSKHSTKIRSNDSGQRIFYQVCLLSK